MVLAFKSSQGSEEKKKKQKKGTKEKIKKEIIENENEKKDALKSHVHRGVLHF